jgi:hypothetical protein
MRRPVVLLLLALPALCVSVSAQAQSWMVGTWFGHGQPQDKAAMYIDRMRPDGSWQGEYRTCHKGQAVDQTQTGRWAMNGDILVLRVELVDGVRAPRTDSYKMQAHTPTSQSYLSLGWNFPYTPQRVADDFKMPSCELIS